ncbi:hypothetical protein CDAR_553251 [Caerostris darwini]|uniref:Uncharacterized protein n=1 Tax=Caerostris darwini TaxID=1538125 RepID=A0AAV4X3F4_9ARAC|nr:hypothetical protein CDAR_553251 [Caerostris darwini]
MDSNFHENSVSSISNFSVPNNNELENSSSTDELTSFSNKNMDEVENKNNSNMYSSENKSTITMSSTERNTLIEKLTLNSNMDRNFHEISFSSISNLSISNNNELENSSSIDESTSFSNKNMDELENKKNSNMENKKNIACQTEILPEMFEKYTDLNALISALHHTEIASKHALESIMENLKSSTSGVEISLDSNNVSQLENSLTKLKEEKLFYSNDTEESSNFEEMEFETTSSFGTESSSRISDIVGQDQKIPAEESFYEKEMCINSNDKDEMKVKMKNESANQRSKVRMGLSRKQKVKPLHPEYIYKETIL